MQLFGCGAKNLMILNIGQFFGFATILIPALTGISNELNPNETVQITAAQASWLCKFHLHLNKTQILHVYPFF